MTIKVKTNGDGIGAVNKVLEHILYTNTTEKQNKLLKSLAFDISDKFTAAHKKAVKKSTLFDQKKTYAITLKFHEAYALEMIIAGYINLVDDQYSKLQLDKLKNYLNQQMA